MNNRKSHPASDAANIALSTALKECNSAGIDPSPHTEILTSLVTHEVRLAMTEMAEHQTSGGPSAIFMLRQACHQQIYFSDAGRQAAQALIKQIASIPQQIGQT